MLDFTVIKSVSIAQNYAIVKYLTVDNFCNLCYNYGVASKRIHIFSSSAGAALSRQTRTWAAQLLIQVQPLNRPK